jgi:Raf kinase inhibitor-like YbhB/YbcL family protein
MAQIVLSSDAFRPGASIPAKFSCHGQDISPELRWGDPPPGTMSFCLILDDPDASRGTFVHWVAYNIPAGKRSLPEGVPATAEVPGFMQQGLNSFQKIGYSGPCPPPGKPHRYFFRLYALSTVLSLRKGAGKEEVMKAMEGQVLAQAELMGVFGR